MSLLKDLDEIRRQMKLDYQDYMQAFAVQREEMKRVKEEMRRMQEEMKRMRESLTRVEEASIRQGKALSRYQKKTDLLFDRIGARLIGFDKRISKLERNAS